MNQISAAENYSIQFTPHRWRMFYNEKPLAEASERGFRYGNRFGATRRLPQDGLLTAEQLQQVVLGWETSDEAWHLGMVLIPELAEARGSRWIELASWPDPSRTLFEEIARQAGEELAAVLGVPFYVAPPKEAEAAQVVEPPLPDLPLSAGVWTMQAAGMDGLLLKRGKRWSRRVLGRAAWYFFWMLVYIFVSGATLTAEIALPNAGTIFPDPQVLPYVGLGVALLLLGLCVNQLLLLFQEPDTIEIDGQQRTIQVRRGEKVIWELAGLDVQSVYVSEVAKKKARNNTTEYGEINLHLGVGAFHMILNHDEPQENKDFPAPYNPFPRTDPEIEEMTADRIATPLQAIGLYIARRLGADAWYDLRLR